MLLLTLILLAATALAAPQACSPETSTKVTPTPTPTPGTGRRRIRIHPKGHKNKCLAIEDAAWPWKFGQWALIRDCKMTRGYVWTIGDLAGDAIQVEGTQWCLNAGTEYHSGFHPRDGTEAQLAYCDPDGDLNRVNTWVYEGGAFKYVNKAFCLDDADGKLAEGSKVQIWTCYNGNRNQQWDIEYLK